MARKRKTCGTCGKSKDAEKAFYHYPDGRTLRHCRECEAKRKKDYNPSRRRARAREAILAA